MIRGGRVLLAALLLVLPRVALAQERITSFDSDISIATNGVVTVRENISVNVENNRIEHGIFRDFPTLYRDRIGTRVRVPFDVESVQLDGHSEPYGIETLDNGKRVRIGSANAIVPRGEHTYLIVYRTNRQIGFFNDYDEFYWNVTGNAWAFRIDRASAAIHLPPGATVKRYDFYTGPQGAQGKDARAVVEGNVVRFSTTSALPPYQGLTIAVGFDKGVVAPPTQADNSRNFLLDNAATIVALIGLIGLSVFYGLAWARFGRDPARGVVVPLFAPPKNFSAAAVRFVDRMGYDRKAFAAALIAMAVKGYIKISESWGTYTLTRTGKSEAEAGLQSTELAIARTLFNPSKTIELKNTNHTIVSRAILALREALTREDEGVYFVTNAGWFFGGLVILVASGAAAALLSDNPALAGFILVWLAGWTWGTSYLFLQVFNAWRGVVMGPGSRIFNFIGAFFSTLFALPFLAALVAGIVFLGVSLSVVTLVAVAAQGLVAAVFHRLLKAPTLAGAKVRDEIAGFRMFLMTAEKDRLEVLHPPQVTPEVFEKFLPYAIALDAENAWSRKFEAEAARAGQASDQSTYTPNWYSGSSFSRFGTSDFASSIGGAIAGATAAAATAPGSSSGSGGGGSSGGGGGGGGGGGW